MSCVCCCLFASKCVHQKNVIVGLLSSMEHVIASVFRFISPPFNTRSYCTVDVDAVDIC